MNGSWAAIAMAAVVLSTSALAQSTTVTWVPFVDPTEKAFAIDMPQGWTVKGGMTRVTPVAAHPWVTASSPDGRMQLFVGDPEVPALSLPKGKQPEGTQVPSQNPAFPPTVVLNYRPGVEFAKFYGPKHLAEMGCIEAALTGTRPMPDLAQMQTARAADMARGIVVNGGYVPPPHEAGLATFSCRMGGATAAGGVMADTTPPPSFGVWHVALVAGYVAAPGEEALALGMLRHVLASRQWNPQWDEAMRQATREGLQRQQAAGAQFSAQLSRQAEAFSAMMQARSDAQIAMQTANHNAYMSEMNHESAARNAQFRNYQAQKSLNSWNFDAHIRNGELYRDVRTGEIVEVDH
jgi:hypothetical protein